MSDRNKPSVVIGTLLIAFGVLVFLGEIFKSTIFHLWPLFIIAGGSDVLHCHVRGWKIHRLFGHSGQHHQHGWLDPVLPDFDQSLGNLVLCLGTHSSQCWDWTVDIW